MMDTLFRLLKIIPFFLLVVPINGLAAVSVDVTLKNQTNTTQTNIPLTFGHVFKPGDVTAGETLGAMLNGISVPVQVDKKATNADGSLRHAIITLRDPSLAANTSDTVTLFNKLDSGSSGTVTQSQLLASNFDSVITLVISGKPYTASARSMLQAGGAMTWLSGPMVSEWVVSAPFKDGGGINHPYLTARFNIRAYSGIDRVRVSAIVENVWTYVANPSNFSYDVSITLNGSQVYSKNNVTHYHQARWRKIFWTGAKPLVTIKHDSRYLRATKAVPNYDYSLNVTESTLSNYYASFASSNNSIMGISILNPYMATTGGRPDIGPLPKWAVLYILTMDKRMWEMTNTIGELGGSWSSHYRDKNTDLPVSLIDYPSLSTHSNVIGNPAYPQAVPVCNNCSTPYTDDESHQPSIAYVPYMMTGDYYLLEELQFWANQNSFRTGGSYRGFEKGLISFLQVRGQAWSMRTYAQTAYITPDNHPLKNYFETILQNNITYFNNRYVTNGGTNSNTLGFIDNGYAYEYNSGRGLSSWQDDFFTWAMGYITELGYTQADPIYKFKSKYPTGRMTAAGFCWIWGAAYTLNTRSSSSSAAYSTFAEVYNASAPSNILSLTCGGAAMATALGLQVGEMDGYSYSPQGYPSNMQPALAVAADSGITNAAQAWQTFSARSVKPYSPAYDVYPNWAIVPRSLQGPPPVPSPVQVPSPPQNLVIR